MKTIRVISNISYNTPEHLEGVLTDLFNRGVIDWAYWIHHKADIDEQKDHAHLVLKPSSRIDTAVLTKEFYELDLTNPKPLGVTSKWNPCNSLEDWLLYAVHDEKYLTSKGQTRNVHYSFDDIKATDYDALRSDWNVIDRRKFDRFDALMDAVENNIPFYKLVTSGAIPVQQMNQFSNLYTALYEEKLKKKSGRKSSHEDSATALDFQNDEQTILPVQPNKDGKTEGELHVEQKDIFDEFIPVEDINF